MPFHAAAAPPPRGTRTAAAALMAAMLGLSAGCATSSTPPSASPAPSATSSSAPSTVPGAGGAGSNARSGPAAGGTSGTVTSVSPAGFLLSTATGQQVTVNEASSTTYQGGTSSTSASALATGEQVLVLGTTSGTTITATQVIVQPAGGGSAGSSGVVPFQTGAPTTSKQVGQIPPNYSEGSGTIVSGTTANQATQAALAAYPGGVVDRVVQLSNGEYEVHYIGVSWPHHIFVAQSFTVVGAV
jgi:hypothetical protein